MPRLVLFTYTGDTPITKWVCHLCICVYMHVAVVRECGRSAWLSRWLVCQAAVKLELEIEPIFMVKLRQATWLLGGNMVMVSRQRVAMYMYMYSVHASLSNQVPIKLYTVTYCSSILLSLTPNTQYCTI